MKDNGELDIICKQQGSLIGGQDINSAFFQAINDSFEGNLMADVFQNPNELLDFEDDFEQKKVNLPSSRGSNCIISLKIPSMLRDGLKDKSIRLRKEAKENGAFKIKDDKLFFYPEYVTDHFFKETASRIAQEIIKLLNFPELSNVNTVVLVGGLSESAVIVSQIEELLTNSFPRVKVVVPTSPFRAILTGAVLYGHNPEIIHSRRSPATFGIATSSLFDEAIHKSEYKFKSSTGKFYCRNVFSVHIKEAEFVVLKEKQPTITYFPLEADQTKARVQVFMHTDEGNMLDPSKVLYTTDKGCTKLGELLVLTPDTKKGTNREISLSLTYGTEIDVSATDETSGETFEVKLEFQNSVDSN